MEKKNSMFPQDYKWQQMILIGLGVLSLGFAIAFIGYSLKNLNKDSTAPVPTKIPISQTQGPKVCQADSDCGENQRCVLAGPVIKGGDNSKHCYPKGEPLPY